ncbi:uncharacterized protein [Drosophila pseudoobscura]|uniref:Uncharacterized protein n=1 Tax=Drosophila pseudoobscura pseudoobscura TaxID=46245 RepID=A0A6I8VNK2_DROPS|nr:uncharacterized protein LOC117183298 [Drosophila pseudoobscura]
MDGVKGQQSESGGETPCGLGEINMPEKMLGACSETEGGAIDVISAATTATPNVSTTDPTSHQAPEHTNQGGGVDQAFSPRTSLLDSWETFAQQRADALGRPTYATAFEGMRSIPTHSRLPQAGGLMRSTVINGGWDRAVPNWTGVHMSGPTEATRTGMPTGLNPNETMPVGAMWHPMAAPALGTNLHGQNPFIRAPTAQYYPSTSRNIPDPYACGSNQAVAPAGVERCLTASQIAARQVINKDLPCFSGNPEEWPMFIVNFEQSTERCGLRDQENLMRLQRCLKGAALEAVRGKLMMPATVRLAIETLRMLYGRPEAIYHTLQTKLRMEPSVKSSSISSAPGAVGAKLSRYC